MRPYLADEQGRLGKGGLNGVKGWNFMDYQDFEEFEDAAFPGDPADQKGFGSESELRDFIMGTGKYSHRDSFFQTPGDTEVQRQEGFFGPLYCHRCVEEFAGGEFEDVMDMDIDARMAFHSSSRDKKSYLRGSNRKRVTDFIYLCTEHPDVALRYTDSEYL